MAYDASGQRVLQATAAQRFHPGTATAYTPAGQVEDADTSATTVGDVTGTRYYTFGGATVAVRTHDGNLALVLSDEQGSVSVTMPVTVNPDGTMASATVADAQAVTVTSYTPYGQLRSDPNVDADSLALDRGWLGQVEDRADATTGTGTGTATTTASASSTSTTSSSTSTTSHRPLLDGERPRWPLRRKMRPLDGVRELPQAPIQHGKKLREPFTRAGEQGIVVRLDDERARLGDI